MLVKWLIVNIGHYLLMVNYRGSYKKFNKIKNIKTIIIARR